MTDAIPAVLPAAPVVAPVAPVADPAAALVAPQGLHPHVLAPDVDNSAPVPDSDLTADQQGLADLTTQFQTFREESTAREAGLQETIQTLITRPAPVAAAAPVAPVAPAVLDLDGLPDPVENPKEFKTQLATVVAGHIATQSQNANQEVLSQVNRASVMNNLWTRFSGEHPELGKRVALARGAADLEFNALRAQGIDPIAIAEQNPESMIGNIVNRMNAELVPAVAVAPVVPGAIPVIPVAPAAPQVARVADIAGPSSLTTPAPTAPKPKGFVQQLKEIQLKDGVI